MATRPHSDTDHGPRLHTHDWQHAIGMGSEPAVGQTMNADHSVEMFRQKFWGTLLLSIPTLLSAPMTQHWFAYTFPGGATASRWIRQISDRWSSRTADGSLSKPRQASSPTACSA
jgi:hypothetical protein